MSVCQMSTRVFVILLIVIAFPAGASKRVLNGKIAFVSDRDPCH